MENSDTKAFRGEDIWVALGLLTRLPLPARHWNAARPAALAAWAYPLAGLVVGVVACALGAAALWLGTPAGFVAALILASLSVLTGAMHEDGMADAADGLWGGHDVTRRLEIMKDSHIGAFGVIALIAGFALRWSALTALIAAGTLWAPVLAVAMISRAAMVGVMHTLPHAREMGLSHMTGRPGLPALGIACALAFVAAITMLGAPGLAILAIAALTALACAAIARAKIGGQTGDILGAIQQMTEITMYACLAALLI
ncbi:cobalamin-5'-phosphate synthase [Litoreibacter ponti]|uniref:Adenosylcobinamide-GDP ribazoletransferase n=1 Tax=Litoreibacter ponti TaxID=1510457 RepID=A0A2T6BKP0_9RHOB|nr:adenosylcobinamide-GDP ribazoletransferase [Litoreibacter ponti]PTX56616.1 cobalamin-5'-phosphate synthase [Litoreibacter ponti]